MSRQYLVPIDLNKNELQNAAIQNLGAAPGTPSNGQIFIDSTAGAYDFNLYQGGTLGWTQLATRKANTFSGKQTFAAVSASISGSINIPQGSANTPISGDIYNLGGLLQFHNGAGIKQIAFTDSAITSSFFLGTTSIALNRVSGAIALTGITSIDGSAASATSAGKSTNLVGGNTTTLLGSIPYQSGVDTTTLLAPNVTAAKMFLSQTGTGANGAAPVWDALVNADIPAALTGKTYNGLTVSTSSGTLTITNAKTLSISNTLTFSGTDGSTLNIGTGGTLGTAAYTNTTAYTASGASISTLGAPTADVGWGGFKITGLAAPVNATDAANKQYVDDTVSSISWKNEVRCATTVAGTFATSFANGSSVDGQILVTGDRILIKDQVAGAENGIFTVNASGAPTRATDADTDAKMKGAAVFVWQGTTNGGTRYINSTAGAIVLDTTPLSWALWGIGNAYSGSNGVLLTAANFTVQPDTGGQSGLSVSTTGVKIDPTVPVGAASTFITRRISFAVGDGAALAYVLTHNLNTRDVVSSVYRTLTPWDEVMCDVEKTSVNTITLRFAVAPTSAQFTCSIIG